MTLPVVLAFVAGLAALVLGASVLVRGASNLALKLGLSPLVVGLTVVAFGTSAPELAVSTGAVLSGQTGMAVGNVVGSNTFNVLFILGLAALITPLTVHRQVIRQESVIMIGAGVLVVVTGLDGGFGGLDGALLLALLVADTVFLVLQSRGQGEDEAALAADLGAPAPDQASAWDQRLPLQLLMVAAGLALLVAGAQGMVWAAVAFARALGISEVVIGLTIVAAGTSLPEVAASVAASLKGQRDMAVGNVVGSCIFNLLGVLGLGAVASSLTGAGALPLPPDVARFDQWVMLAALAACLPVFLTGRQIARWEGALFLAYYLAYTAYLVMAAQRHQGIDAFADAMLGFVLPLTVVSLGVALLPRPGARPSTR